ncbi:MAG: thiol-disulfide oxidoreductase DCC family protein [Vicingaceae bacterium]
MNTTNKYIILFDGACNFCSFWVKYVIKRDKKDVFRFVSLQSEKGKELLNKYNIELDLSTVVLIKDDAAKTKSSAALHIFKNLGEFYSLGIIFIIVPKFIRDFCYDIIAKNRKKILKNESCLFPDDTVKAKFLN